MKYVDSKSREMNKALMFRAHLNEHPAWRRPHHDNPSPATWSWRRLHHAISCPTRHTSSRTAQRLCPRQPQQWPVCQTQTTAQSQAAPPRDLSTSRPCTRNDHPWLRQLSTHSAHDRHRHISAARTTHRSAATHGRIERSTNNLQYHYELAQRSAGASVESFFRSTPQDTARPHGDCSPQSNDAPRLRTSASHRSCSRRFASASLRSKRSRSLAPYISAGGGL